MNNITPIGQPNVPNEVRAFDGKGPSTKEPGQQRVGDRVELSVAAQLLSRIHQLPDIRQDLIDRVQAEIKNGTYETEERLEGAVIELEQDLEDIF